ncbi:MAG TPA: DUF2530 domain-containing protein [Diaminobutyricibacter sp.]
MRLWLRDSERRADPVPVVTDDRKAIATGLVLWLVALVLVLVFAVPLSAASDSWWLWTVLIGLGLGVVGLVYVSVKRR